MPISNEIRMPNQRLANSSDLCHQKESTSRVLVFLFLSFLFLPENSSTHFQHCFESFSSSFGVLAESLHCGIFYLALDLLPTTAESGDLSFLFELRAFWFAFFCPAIGGHAVRQDWLIYHGFPHGEDIAPGEVVGNHGHTLCNGIDVGSFVNV